MEVSDLPYMHDHVCGPMATLTVYSESAVLASISGVHIMFT